MKKIKLSFGAIILAATVLGTFAFAKPKAVFTTLCSVKEVNGKLCRDTDQTICCMKDGTSPAEYKHNPFN